MLQGDFSELKDDYFDLRRMSDSEYGNCDVCEGHSDIHIRTQKAEEHFVLTLYGKKDCNGIGNSGTRKVTCGAYNKKLLKQGGFSNEKTNDDLRYVHDCSTCACGDIDEKNSSDVKSGVDAASDVRRIQLKRKRKKSKKKKNRSVRGPTRCHSAIRSL